MKFEVNSEAPGPARDDYAWWETGDEVDAEEAAEAYFRDLEDHGDFESIPTERRPATCWVRELGTTTEVEVLVRCGLELVFIADPAPGV